MYTRCPSCRSEISFEPPANMESLPEGYKHRIKCPCCGVTIGVKINKIDTTAYPNYNPQFPVPVGQGGGYGGYDTIDNQTSTATASKKKSKSEARADKKTGIVRNIFMILLSLVMVAVSVVGYFVAKGRITVELLGGLKMFDGISFFERMVNDIAGLESEFKHETLSAVMGMLPSVLFVLSGLNAMIAIIFAASKTYPRVFNLIFSLLIGAVAVVILFAPGIINIKTEGYDIIAEHFFPLVVNKAYLSFAGAGLGLLQIFFAICFCAPMTKKK